ncbi:hypothetical protein [Myroides sp. N17-2]|uniref:hypothetical protein n=1 Tax=Myroides sp. N17-2 TaxID=2030799 RepID=UPI000EFB8493|nr:hypothetical protein [Myroides sp. N17-2]
MKYIKMHKENLLSVKSDNILLNSSTFIEILELFHKEAHGAFYIEGSRETYEYDTSVIKCQIEKTLKNGKILQYSDFETIISGVNINSELISVLWRFWFAYEHVMICFLLDDINEINLKRNSWYEITERYKSYVLFKGIEEDTILIGKSEELNFDFLM